ncbi:hypothetical protein, partial [Aminobacter carboxidus]|uniref:hypothetical protein n=1 Tax=Aminobacter carboxidus TaxID=376165 RepID=UPI001AEEA9BB
VTGSNPVPATKYIKAPPQAGLLCIYMLVTADLKPHQGPARRQSRRSGTKKPNPGPPSKYEKARRVRAFCYLDASARRAETADAAGNKLRFPGDATIAVHGRADNRT